MNKMNKVRRDELEPDRMEYGKLRIEELGYKVQVSDRVITFLFKGNNVNYFPYTGWFSGKGIKDGRGIHNLLIQINNEKV